MLIKLNPEQGSNSLQFYKVERGEGAAEGKFEVRRSWFMVSGKLPFPESAK